MPPIRTLLEYQDRLTPADHQTHRRVRFSVPPGVARLRIHVRYEPKLVSAAESARLVASAVAAQTTDLSRRISPSEAQRWAADFDGADLRVPNLLTISLDDAAGSYRGAGHRHAQDQDLWLDHMAASPGLVPGELPPGDWSLTLSAHTLVSAQCEVSIQIGAEIA